MKRLLIFSHQFLVLFLILGSEEIVAGPALKLIPNNSDAIYQISIFWNVCQFSEFAVPEGVKISRTWCRNRDLVGRDGGSGLCLDGLVGGVGGGDFRQNGSGLG